MKYFLTPGPGHIFPGVKEWVAEGLAMDIGSISHRSQDFMDIHAGTVGKVKTLFNLPEGYHVFFHSSATEIWERLPQNCVMEKSFHFVNGSFSQRFHKAALDLGFAADKTEAPWGKGFDFDPTRISQEVEMINFTHNETSTGVMLPLEEVYAFRDSHPQALITLDMVSSAPFPEIDWNYIDAAYFSVQKCFGMPSGLGVLVLNDRVLQKTEQKRQAGKSIGTYHNFLAQFEKYQKSQTVETPNTLGIYILGKVCEAMLARGLEKMRAQCKDQALQVYNYFDSHPQLPVFVQEKRFRSSTVIVIEVPQGHRNLMAYMEDRGIILGNGYGKMKGKQIRIANFPALPSSIFSSFLTLCDGFEQ